MIKELEDQLKHINVYVILSLANQEKYPGKLQALITGKPRRKPNNEDAVKTPKPIILIGTGEQLDNELDQQKIASQMYDFTHQVINDKAFKESIKENAEEAASDVGKTKAKVGASKTASKKGATTTVATDPNLSVLKKMMEDMDLNLKKNDRAIVDKTWIGIASLTKTIGGDNIPAETVEALKALGARRKALPEQTSLLDQPGVND